MKVVIAIAVALVIGVVGFVVGRDYAGPRREYVKTAPHSEWCVTFKLLREPFGGDMLDPAEKARWEDDEVYRENTQCYRSLSACEASQKIDEDVVAKGLTNAAVKITDCFSR